MGMGKKQAKNKLWMKGFLGFLGFLGFQAFSRHDPWWLFYFCFFAFFSHFKYLKEELKYLGGSWDGWFNHNDAWNYWSSKGVGNDTSVSVS